MTTRWDVERAVLASDLSAPSRLVMMTLLTRVNVKTAVIPGEHTPSLTDLASMTGLDRSTVAKRLNALERDHWIRRKRPPVEQSRRGVKTRYALTVPSGSRPLASGSEPLGVVAQDHMPSGPRPPIDTNLEPSQTTRARAREDDDEVIETVIRVIRETTGRTVSREYAAKVVRDILGDRRPRNPVGYVEKAIRNDPDRFKPYSGPPRFRGGRFIEEDDS